jgi:predicted aspartyl protease
MLQGYFDDENRALLRLRVRGRGNWSHVTAEIDTGAQPAIVTSLTVAEALDAEIEAKHIATLADGAKVPACLVALEVDWFGEPKLVVGVAFVGPDGAGFGQPGRRGRRPNALIGRGLLGDCRLTIDYGRATVAVDRSEGAAA